MKLGTYHSHDPNSSTTPWEFDPTSAAIDIEETRKKAEAGDANAQVVMGDAYLDPSNFGYVWFHDTQQDKEIRLNLPDTGFTQDLNKALEWYQKAAAQGQAQGQYNLGQMYFSARGVPKDSAKAVEWYEKSAAQGYAQAQISLGWMYEEGEGVPKDAAKAAAWYEKAAAQGDVSGQYILGSMYANGNGVPKDAAKAAEWYQKSATQGHEDAQYFLGWMYRDGEGVPKDAAKAAEWLMKAAAQGHVGAQATLGWLYRNGVGVPKNIVLAYAWSNLAAAQGDETAQGNRDLYEAQLTLAQRAEGQRLASNWKKGDTLQVSAEYKNTVATNDKPSKRGSGTAFAVSSAGHALTNHHVINGCVEVRVAGHDGVAKVITADTVNDLALLQLPSETKDYAHLNPEPGKLRQGEDVLVFGYPLEWALSSGGNLTPGIISALSGLGNNTNQIQITAPIQPGSSGSPVMDKKGNVAGVVSMKLDDGKMAKVTGQVGQNVNFAVNGQTMKAFLDANQVPYQTGGGVFSWEQSNADIAESARKFTMLVECWK